jgi:hypothetical protein
MQSSWLRRRLLGVCFVTLFLLLHPSHGSLVTRQAGDT